jgi:hypothetical protein
MEKPYFQCLDTPGGHTGWFGHYLALLRIFRYLLFS